MLALAVAPAGFTISDLAAKVQTMTGQTDDRYTVRHAAYDLARCEANTWSAGSAAPTATTCHPKRLAS